MSDLAIKVQGISKRYRIRSTAQPYYFTLRDTLSQAATSAARRLTRGGRRSAARRSTQNDHVWSLKDVSFEVGGGEVLGVIGPNGAGKTTLLKILSRITEPTSGWAEIRGRVGSLLEVGTGFHEELSGRENVYLSGAILGMTKRDIDRKFDAIVAFAEVDKFIDTPVKHYSSGMYMRLAFSVAAYLEPDVLLVDEVLAVGDMAFQQKCLDKMGDIAAGGRTVLFVSHNLAAVKQFCRTAIVLNDGMLAFRGSAVDGVAHYMQSFLSPTTNAGERGTRWTHVTINGRPSAEIVSTASSEVFRADALLDCPHAFSRGRFVCQLADGSQTLLVAQSADHKELGLKAVGAGKYNLNVTFPPLWLAPGIYNLSFKFIGELNSVQSVYESGPALINVTGRPDGPDQVTLAPPRQWTLRPM